MVKYFKKLKTYELTNSNSIKIVQYQTFIKRKSRQIKTNVIAYIDDQLSKEAIEEINKNSKYSVLEENSEIVRKIIGKDYACLEFICEEGDEVKVHEK